jgi:hypothetical protein
MAKQTKSEQLKALGDETRDRIRADIARSRPGLWSEECPVKPSCTCGLKDQSRVSSGARFNPAPNICHLHNGNSNGNV